MTVVAPFRWFGMFRATSAILFGLTLLWVVISWLFFRDMVVSQLLAALILGTAALLGPLVYVRFYRLKLQYDAHGFTLFSGQTQVAAGQWQHFSRVSLYHRGYGVFAVRLYTPEQIYVDLPASDLKLDPQAFREYVTQKVKANTT